ncbi:putative PAS/PAC sensor protein [Thermosinus carboxydivorans Nor1]|uniref:Putative PAS/PAC sensor protein n=2 Tax=Thermosinus TaxID=261684 RepID=A1HLS8_9FIRM|nr:putative PAS/PAC sensor protein [Thermosinus carboxydivorans Nor1]
MTACIAVFALGETTAKSIAGQLAGFFASDKVIIQSHCLERPQALPTAPIKADVAVISSSAVLPLATPHIHPATRTLVARRSLGVAALDALLALPNGTKVLVCHKYPAGCRELAASIRELGMSHIECYSLYDDDHELCKTITTAVVAGDRDGLPPWIKKVIDIGSREVELASLVEIAHIINYPLDNSGLLTLRYSREIVRRTERLQQAVKHIEALHNQIRTVLNTVQDALVAIDNNGNIRVLNDVARRLAVSSEDGPTGKWLFDVFPGLRGCLSSRYEVVAGKNLVQMAGKTYHVTVSPVKDSGGMTDGCVVALRDVTDVMRMESEVRSALKARGHLARYTFDDILGISPAIRATIQTARKLAASDLNVLILGENGTGKELFAHSIHNASGRAGGPFVAANCAALPASLIESELFGYEEGAFTGAKRGGKPGLIEQAHGGTIFLDEIGDISPEAQARLLRVIQEKEVMRLGCTRIIPVDVRIIAATNRDLKELVRQQKFRQDLYYRLFVAPLPVPPLRERKQDIPYLTCQFLRENGLSADILDDELADALVAYDWPGNVRELQSVIQYAAVIADSPAAFRQAVRDRIGGVRERPSRLPVNLDRQELPLYFALLDILREAKALGYALGRGQLARRMAERGFFLSEQAIRRRLEHLKAAGSLTSGRGRQATRITPAGEELWAALWTEIGCKTG